MGTQIIVTAVEHVDVMELRELQPDDWELWRVVRLQALAGAPEAFSSKLEDWQGAGDREERWRSRLQAVGFNVVALVDGVPVGQASGTDPDEANDVELLSVWVHPSARGTGVGRGMIESVAAWAKSRGAASVSLAVFVENSHARELYERAGFVTDSGAVPSPGQTVMARRLS